MEQVHFCPYMGYPPILAQPPDVYQNVAFLARTNHLDIVSILHKELNLPNPLADNWALQSPLIGIKIAKGQAPIFPYIMLKTSSNLIYVTV